jgi:SNF2 family DNA or RNA helicase
MITVQNSCFIVPAKWTARVRGAPERKYLASKKLWQLGINAANKHYLRANFAQAEFDALAWDSARPVGGVPLGGSNGTGRFPTSPAGLLLHQGEGLDKAYGKSAFAFFHEMGSGKSRTLLELWTQYFKEGRIVEAWIFCPNTLTGNWLEQIDIWAPHLKPYIEVYGIASLQAGGLPDRLLARAHNALAVAVDESQSIKNFKAKRSEVVQAIGLKAAYTAILTGTAITKGVGDLYSQFQFLDPKILGFRSYYSFRNRYCILGGFENKQIIGYQNLNELLATIEPWTHVVSNPVQLPPQGHETRDIKVSAEQKRLLRELKALMATSLDNKELTVENALSFYTRGAQIIGGHFATDSGIIVPLEHNPKLDELKEICEATNKKLVVFCRFVPEVKLIHSSLTDYGSVRLDPDIEEPIETVNRFQKDPTCRILVSTYARGSRGFIMTAGKILVRYSGTFAYEELVQSEKRIHRIGQDEETMVIDLLANVQLDHHMRDIAEGKKSLAAFVTESLENPKKLLSLFDDLL